MWRFKQFMPKEQTGLEGRTVEVGNLKIHVRNVIAEGGFSCVYLARDAVHYSKQYALKHMICNDDESLDLVKKEISVMKLLRGHPNAVFLQAHGIFDMGRTKEALLVMELCEKTLVGVLENRGAGYFEEKQILLIFRDICNAVYAMHCQSPPIAHRDLKVENVLLGPDGAWKLCDFGSISTNHKCFDRPEEMGIEEDNIRKHTTPAYRAPEMWDLFRKEVISEKVDIWALGCLLYRICYFKSAFDGESKLQILNGNYRIPDLPKYSSSIIDLMKDMLQSSPDTRPDITQVWFRVNLQLPEELQKQMPDGSISMMTAADSHLPSDANDEATPMPAKKAPLMPRRTPPPPPSSKDQLRHVSPPSLSTKDTHHSKPSQSSSTAALGGAPLGAFWSTQHAKDSQASDDKGPVYDDGPSEDFEIRFFPEKIKETQPENTGSFQNEAFNTFVAEFDTSKLESKNNNGSRSEKEELEAEVNRLKEQLKQANLEKAEMISKHEKLSAICRSQRQEIQELKVALASGTLSPIKDGLKSQNSPGSGQSTTTQRREKIEGSVWELQQGMLGKTPPVPSPDSKSWQAFADEPKPQPLSKNNHARSVRTTNGHQNKHSVRSSGADNWDFGQDSFTAVPVPASSHISKTFTHGNDSQRFDGPKNIENKPTSQPAGWAGF